MGIFLILCIDAANRSFGRSDFGDARKIDRPKASEGKRFSGHQAKGHSRFVFLSICKILFPGAPI